MEEKKFVDAVSAEFHEEELARQRKSMASCISIYARSVSDIAVHIANGIINAQADQLLTDAEIAEKLNTTYWSEQDFDKYRASMATLDLRMINENMQYLLDGIVRLMEVIKWEGGERHE